MKKRFLALFLCLVMVLSTTVASAASFDFAAMQQSPFYSDVLMDILGTWVYSYFYEDFSYHASGSPEYSSKDGHPGFRIKVDEVEANRIDFTMNGQVYSCRAQTDVNSFFLCSAMVPLLDALLQTDEVTITGHLTNGETVVYELSGETYATGLKAYVQGLYDLGIAEIALNDPVSAFVFGKHMRLVVSPE